MIGVSTAQQLARAGADVILLTESVLTSGASGRSLSWLNSAGIWREPYQRLRTAAIDCYPTLSAHQLGLRWLRFAGGLVWCAAEQSESGLSVLGEATIADLAREFEIGTGVA